jgi:beta-lactamase regulating signal transducer with metallopeptidase domain
MNFFNELNQPLSSAIGWTIIHSLWIATGCAALVGIALGLLRETSSRLRYIIACLGLCMTVVLISITLIREWKIQSEKSEARRIAFSLQLKSRPAATGEIQDLIQPMPSKLTTVDKMLPELALFWTMGVILFSIRNIRAWRSVRRLETSALKIANDDVEARFQAFAARLGIDRPVKLLKSAALEIPVAIGWLRPLVILPLSTFSGLGAKELDTILLHELAHISRRDYLVNLFQTAVETLLFYHPAIWWISARIREEREDCCDDLVIELQGDRTTYAKALASLEHQRSLVPQLTLPASAGGLLRRIRRIANGRRDPKTWPIGMVTGAIVCGCLILFLNGSNSVRAGGNSNRTLELRRVIEPGSDEVGKEAKVAESNEKMKVSNEVLLDTSSIVSARVVQDAQNNPAIRIQFTEIGKKLLASMTQANLEKRIAILQNGVVLMAPVVRTPIEGGLLEISGNFIRADADKIAIAINQSVKTPPPGEDTNTQPKTSQPPKSSQEPSTDPVKELESLKRQLEASSAEIARLESKMGLMRAQSDLNQVRGEAAQATQVITEIQRKLNTGASLETIPEINNNPTVQRLKQEIAIQDANLEGLLKRYRHKHPAVIQATEQLARLRENLDGETRNVFEVMKNGAVLASVRQRSLEGVVAEEQKKQTNLTQLRIQNDVLKREPEEKASQPAATEQKRTVNTSTITVTGPVRTNTFAIPPGQGKKLSEIVLGAGPSEFANLKKVHLLRVNPENGKTEETIINVQAIIKDPSKDVPVQEGDRIDIVEKNILFQ